jgi:hypothetical protein
MGSEAEKNRFSSLYSSRAFVFFSNPSLTLTAKLEKKKG